MPTRSYREQNVFGKRLKIPAKMNRAFQRQNFLFLRLDAKMAERCLVERLHALRCHCDFHATDLKQRHRAKIDIAVAGDRAGRSDLSIAKLLDLERPPERHDTFRAVAPAEIYRDVCAFAPATRTLHRSLLAHVPQGPPLSPTSH